MTLTTTTPNTRSIVIGTGVISMILGVILLVWPEATVTVLAYLLGIDLLLLGVGILIGSFAGETSVGEKILGGFLGVLSLLAGVAVFGRPLQSVGVLVVVVGAFWVVGGVIQVILGLFGAVTGSRFMSVVGGLISVAFGAVALAWPGPTVAVLIWLTGIWSLLAGLIWLIRGLRMPSTVTA